MTCDKNAPIRIRMIAGWMLLVIGILAVILGIPLATWIGWHMSGELSSSQEFGRASLYAVGVVGVLMIFLGWVVLRKKRES